jgi:hypothetical protein
MRFLSMIIASSALALSAPAFAQAAAPIAPGMQIVDTTGASVGTVSAIQGDNVLVKTDKHETLVPKASFTVNNGKLLFGMTQAQLNAEVEKGLAAAEASVAQGATVKGANGKVLGTIDTVDAESVTMKLPSGQLVKMPRQSVRGNVDGTVTSGLTSEQLEAQVSSGAGADSAK